MTTGSARMPGDFDLRGEGLPVYCIVLLKVCDLVLVT